MHSQEVKRWPAQLLLRVCEEKIERNRINNAFHLLFEHFKLQSKSVTKAALSFKQVVKLKNSQCGIFRKSSR